MKKKTLALTLALLTLTQTADAAYYTLSSRDITSAKIASSRYNDLGYGRSYDGVMQLKETASGRTSTAFAVAPNVVITTRHGADDASGKLNPKMLRLISKNNTIRITKIIPLSHGDGVILITDKKISNTLSIATQQEMSALKTGDIIESPGFKSGIQSTPKGHLLSSKGSAYYRLDASPGHSGAPVIKNKKVIGVVGFTVETKNNPLSGGFLLSSTDRALINHYSR